GLVINIADVSQLKQAELENQSLRERLQFLLAASPGIIYSCTVDGYFRYTFISDTVQTLLGYTTVEWLASPDMWITHLHPDDAPCVLNCLMPLLANDRHTHEYRLRHRDGHYTWVRDEMQLVRNPNGEILEIVGCWVAIDDRKASELALAESQRQYQTLVENSPDVIERFDVNLRHLYVSPSLTRMTGIPVDACLGKTYRELGMDEAMVERWEAAAADLLATGQKQVIEFSIPTPQGVRSFEMALVPELSAHQTIESILCISRDVTDRKAAEAALHEQQLFIQQIAESTLAILYVYDLLKQQMVYTSPQITTVLGYSSDELQAMGGNLFSQLLHPDDLPSLMVHHQQFRADDHYVEAEYRIRHKSGRYRWLLSRDRVLNRTPEGKPRQIVGVAVDITLLKHTQVTLHQQAERERIVTAIAQKIRQTLDLEQVLETTVTEIRQFLQVDRVIIYQFTSDWSGAIVAESVVAGWKSILGMQVADTYFVDTQGKPYAQGRIHTIDDIYTTNLQPCYLELLEAMQVRAKLVVPILQHDHLWGLLVAQHCQAPRHWEPWEVDLHKQLATQLAIAIQQSELYQQVQALNASLELQVQERTAQLQQALEFESLLKRITDRVRDSLDEEQILQSVVEELAQQLALVGCDTGIYNAEHTISAITHEFTTTLASAQGKTFEIATSPHPEIYTYLLQGQWCQFCSITPNPLRSNQGFLSILAVPIVDDRGVLGDLWLFKPPSAVFDSQEVRLVEQVANQCAIALRQSRLYQAAQAQVKELERLNLLKDDFLSTVSHELRSPMASIKMATQMLEISLKQENVLTDETRPINRYLKVLHEEEDREINLINDLLDLARVDAGTEPLNLTAISLQFYLPHISEAFAECARQQQQHLIIEIPDDLPPLTTDLATLERIITELLHNACKYTPSGETISIHCCQ
ncbi:MAG: PAS domain-containing protein, partial [Cyanobacteria bacterium]|nr:PAS domain-containing protein [Cyanobacteriota bacterium]MDW8202991.1 PAS domain-containing protein [Cyanobacteriota bacterium SKYGB_h_bin112]